MCILFVAVDRHPDYPLIIAANRDEFFSRPSAPAEFWRDHPRVLGGRDLSAGGTWLGVTADGRVAAVTNVRTSTPNSPDARSRGALVSDYLVGEQSPAEYAGFVTGRSRRFNPFNLLFGTIEELLLASSHASRPEKLGPGFHSIGNAPPGHRWPKMSHGEAQLRAHLRAANAPDPQALFDIMRDRAAPSDAALPNTGIGLRYERALSTIFVTPICINGQTYGTRATTLVLCSNSKIRLWECRYTAEGNSSPARYRELGRD